MDEGGACLTDALEDPRNGSGPPSGLMEEGEGDDDWPREVMWERQRGVHRADPAYLEPPIRGPLFWPHLNPIII